ncbi:MAG: glycosyltransferase [Armatimonadota bacterium]|nr:glycosyltransferase [Armatimonadota bacterium]
MSDERVRVMQVVEHVALGGATLMAMTLAERLDPSRYSVALAAGTDAGAEGSLADEIRQRGIELLPVPHLGRAISPLRDIRAAWEVAELLRTHRPQIVHTHGSKSKLLLPLAAQVAPVPIAVAHLWGWEWHPARATTRTSLVRATGTPARGSLNATREQRTDRAVRATAAPLAMALEARLVAEWYDALIACSAAIRDEGLAHGVGSSGTYEVIRPSIDPERFRPGDGPGRERVRRELELPEDAVVVGSVMRLAPQKDPGTLIRAAALVAAFRRRVHWLIVGGGPLEDDVRERVERLGLADRVRLVGPRRDVPRLLQACDLFALSSAWEPFGIAYLEASAMGLPVVGTRVNGAPEAVIDGETGLLVPPGRYAALAAAVSRLAGDPDLARRMGEAGRCHARQFRHERFVAAVEALYERLLRR